MFNKYVDTDTVYDPGRHFIGPWNSFVLFPSSVRSIEFSNEVKLESLGMRYPALHTRTKEGLALHLQVSLQYRLIKDHIGDLYKEFNKDFEKFFLCQIRDTLIKAAADYEGPQLWINRRAVSARMYEMVNEVLGQTYAECWGLQLMVIELPKEFEDSIVATQVVQQNVSTMENEQIATQIRAETDVIRSLFAKKVKVVEAAGHKNYTLATKTARAHARSRTLETEAEVMSKVKERLNLRPKDLVEYQEYSAVAMLANASVLFGFEDDTGILLSPSGEGRSPTPAPVDGGRRSGNSGRKLEAGQSDIRVELLRDEEL